MLCIQPQLCNTLSLSINSLCGRSPKALTYELLQAELQAQNLESIPPYGMLPISVLGTVDGWFELHNKFGSLPMNRILQPLAID